MIPITDLRIKPGKHKLGNFAGPPERDYSSLVEAHTWAIALEKADWEINSPEDVAALVSRLLKQADTICELGDGVEGADTLDVLRKRLSDLQVCPYSGYHPITPAEQCSYMFRDSGAYLIWVKWGKDKMPVYELRTRKDLDDMAVSHLMPDWVYQPKAGIGIKDVIQIHGYALAKMIPPYFLHVWFELAFPTFHMGYGTGRNYDQLHTAGERVSSAGNPLLTCFAHPELDTEQFVDDIMYLPGGHKMDASHTMFPDHNLRRMLIEVLNHPNATHRRLVAEVAIDMSCGIHASWGPRNIAFILLAVGRTTSYAPHVLNEIYRRKQPWRHELFAAGKDVKQVHEGVVQQKAIWSKHLPDHVSCQVQYCHHFTMRGSEADAAEDGAERQDPRIDLMFGLSSDGLRMSAKEWWPQEIKLIDAQHRAIYANCRVPAQATRSDERQYTLDALTTPSGSAGGYHAQTVPELTVDEALDDLRICANEWLSSFKALSKRLTKKLDPGTFTRHLFNSGVVLVTDGQPSSFAAKMAVEFSTNPKLRDGLLVVARGGTQVDGWKAGSVVQLDAAAFASLKARLMRLQKAADMPDIISGWHKLCRRSIYLNVRTKGVKARLSKLAARAEVSVQSLMGAIADLQWMVAADFQKYEIFKGRVLWAVKFLAMCLSRRVIGELDKQLAAVDGMDSATGAFETIWNNYKIGTSAGSSPDASVFEGVGIGADAVNYNLWHPGLMIALQGLRRVSILVEKYNINLVNPGHEAGEMVHPDFINASVRNSLLWMRIILELQGQSVMLIESSLVSGALQTHQINTDRNDRQDERALIVVGIMLRSTAEHIKGNVRIRKGRGDDKVAMFQNWLLMACYFIALSAEGVPFGLGKSSQYTSNEYLRRMISTDGCVGYPLRSLAVSLSQHFESNDKVDALAAASSKAAQTGFNYRRGMDSTFCHGVLQDIRNDLCRLSLRDAHGNLMDRLDLDARYATTFEGEYGAGIVAHQSFVSSTRCNKPLPSTTALTPELMSWVTHRAGYDLGALLRTRLVDSGYSYDVVQDAIRSFAVGVSSLALKSALTPREVSQQYEIWLRDLAASPPIIITEVGRRLHIVGPTGQLADSPRAVLLFGTPLLGKSGMLLDNLIDIDDHGGQYDATLTSAANWSQIRLALDSAVYSQFDSQPHPVRVIMIGGCSYCLKMLLAWASANACFVHVVVNDEDMWRKGPWRIGMPHVNQGIVQVYGWFLPRPSRRFQVSWMERESREIKSIALSQNLFTSRTVHMALVRYAPLVSIADDLHAQDLRIAVAAATRAVCELKAKWGDVAAMRAFKMPPKPSVQNEIGNLDLATAVAGALNTSVEDLNTKMRVGVVTSSDNKNLSEQLTLVQACCGPAGLKWLEQLTVPAPLSVRIPCGIELSSVVRTAVAKQLVTSFVSENVGLNQVVPRDWRRIGAYSDTICSMAMLWDRRMAEFSLG